MYCECPLRLSGVDAALRLPHSRSGNCAGRGQPFEAALARRRGLASPPRRPRNVGDGSRRVAIWAESGGKMPFCGRSRPLSRAPWRQRVANGRGDQVGRRPAPGPEIHAPVSRLVAAPLAAIVSREDQCLRVPGRARVALPAVIARRACMYIACAVGSAHAHLVCGAGRRTWCGERGARAPPHRGSCANVARHMTRKNGSPLLAVAGFAIHARTRSVCRRSTLVMHVADVVQQADRARDALAGRVLSSPELATSQARKRQLISPLGYEVVER